MPIPRAAFAAALALPGTCGVPATPHGAGRFDPPTSNPHLLARTPGHGAGLATRPDGLPELRLPPAFRR